MTWDWSRREWQVAAVLTALAIALVLNPSWFSAANGPDRMAQSVLQNAALAQSLAFSGSSPPTYVSCAGRECGQRLRLETPAGLFLWMEADGAEFTGRALHAGSDTVWVWRTNDRRPHAETATASQRAARDAFLSQPVAVAATAATAVDELIAALHDPDDSRRVRAADALRRRGPGAAAAVPALIENIGPGSGKRQAINLAATNALLAIGPRAALEPLIAALKSDDRDIASGAALTIAGFGAAARPAVPALLDALRDPERRDDASAALAEIERES